MPTLRAAALAVLVATLVLGVSATPGAALARAQFPVQSVGNSGLAVVALQHLLRHHGAQLEVTGVFGSPTRTALVAFQRSNGLHDDGVARPDTWQALVPRLELGAAGEAVHALQKLLNGKRGAGLNVDGRFDAATRQALAGFQKRLGLRQSGLADTTTWRLLVWYFERPELEHPLCGYDLHGGRSAKWGTSAVVAQLSAAALLYNQRTGKRVAVGDISLALGGRISGHATHRVGLDVDLRPARKDDRECRWGIAHTMRSYDRAATRELIRAIHESAPGHVKLIYFNDPVLVEEGLVTRYRNHDAHLHVRYCEADHPQPAYRCPATATQAATLIEPVDAAGTVLATGAAIDSSAGSAWPGAGEQLRNSPWPW